MTDYDDTLVKRQRSYRQVAGTLLAAGLIEEIKTVAGEYPYHKVSCTFRLTQAGRKAVEFLDMLAKLQKPLDEDFVRV